MRRRDTAGELPVARLQFDIREVSQDSGAHGLEPGVDDGAELALQHVTRAAQVAVPQELLAEQAAHRRRPRGGAVDAASASARSSSSRCGRRD